MTLILFLLGLILLAGGAAILVRGAARLAAAMGVSPLVIGLTVVAFATSAPEMAVGIRAALTGAAGGDLAVGNIVGSNIFNILFVLGISSVIAPLCVTRQLVRVDVPIMISVSILTFLLAYDGRVGTFDGLLLFACAIAYTIFAIVMGRRDTPPDPDEYAVRYGGPSAGRVFVVNGLYIVAGLGLLVLGAHWMVNGAIALARTLGMSELVIGLTVVAAGTSLPEVATAVMASLRGQRDIAVGNVVGSCIYNLVAVLGLVTVVTPGGLPVSTSVLAFDLPVMVTVALICLPIFFTRYIIARWEGGLFLGYYVGYTAFLLLAAAEHDALRTFTTVVIFFAGPLTLLMLALTAWRQSRREFEVKA